MVGVIPDENEDCPDWDADSLRALCSFIKDRPEEKPFCAFLGVFNPHPPYGVEREYYDRVDPALISDQIPTPEHWEGLPSMLKHLHDEMHLTMSRKDWKEMQRYYAMCMKVDDYAGQPCLSGIFHVSL